ncbi:peptidoglycan-binding protein [Halalkalibacter urbisdiaboli]|uniref:C40 family peptidase n=1 Tax=Halalkalibacter urbisdiaboli TaxID=1960589 RepID=UPI0013FD3B10|nr:peptidoglycan-binding protein [Halalkalibacter urbisdiaboli]
MKATSKGKLLISTVIVGSALHIPFDLKRAEAADVPQAKKIEENQIIRFGDQGENVLSLQAYLKALAYYKGAHDGIFGPRTKQAVIQYQASHSLITDGIAGPITLGHLLTSESIVKHQVSKDAIVHENENDPTKAITTSEPSETLSGQSLLKEGATGEQVKSIQEQLEKYGYYQGVDGIFGAKTKKAVRAFQAAHNLQVDGVVGPETRAVLINEEKEISPYSKEIEQITEKQTVQTESVNHDSSLVDSALSLKGSPYKWGGTSPAGFDCSGFLQYVFKNQGVSIPRTVQEIYSAGQSVSNLQLGDLVFFTTYKSGPSHAGIYIGGNQFVHAGSSTGVTVSSLDQSYWSTRYIGAKRL